MSLSKHSNWFKNGAKSLSNAYFIHPIELLNSFLLGEMKDYRVLFASRDKSQQSGRKSRQSVDTLRAE